MARLSNGFLGNASGKLGNVVFAKWKEIYTARQYQPDIHDANSPAQKAQRSRMVTLLQYLKPLNKNFIAFFNSKECKGSTPWAKAIKDNMAAITPDGCFQPDLLKFGNPKYPAVKMEEVMYNPFIDLVSIKYSPVSHPSMHVRYPYIISSVLGKYKSESGLPEFDTRHPVCMMPSGSFFCSFYDDMHEHCFENWWSNGWLWMMYYDTYDIESIFNPNSSLTMPRPFTAKSMIEGFNTDVTENPVPLEAFKWEYQLRVTNWFLVLTLDRSLCNIPAEASYNMLIWSVLLKDNTSAQADPFTWDLRNASFEIDLGPEGFNGSILGLFNIVTSEGVQVSKFNRFYINKDTGEREYPYFDQLFACNYAHPVSYILKGDQCGFCGSIDELFSDFIELWNQGVIHDPKYNPGPTKNVLHMGTDPNGKTNVFGFDSQTENDYVFDSTKKAFLNPVPGAGFKFSEWTGADAGSVVKVTDDTHELDMTKERAVSPVFTII